MPGRQPPRISTRGPARSAPTGGEPAGGRPVSAGTISCRILELCWLLLALATPSLFNPSSLRVFEPEKIAFVRTVVLAMVALWVVRHLLGSTLGAWRGLPSRLIAVPFLPPVAALMLAYLLSALVSELPAVGLLGSYRRQFGVLTHLSYAALFLMVAIHLRTPRQPHRLLVAIALGSLVPALYALAQHLGLDPISWSLDHSRRVVGTLGQPTYLGDYLAALLPATLYLVATSSRWRVPASALLALQAAALVLSQSRGPLVGAAVGALVVVATLPWGRRAAARLRLRWWLAMGFAGLSLVVVINLPGTEANRLARSVPYLERLATLADLESGSGGVRSLIWQTVPALVAERPLLGHGPEMMGYAFERHYPPALAYAENRTASADHAHNLLLQQLVSTGLLGLAVLLWLLADLGRRAPLILRPSPPPGWDGGTASSSPEGKGAGEAGPGGPGAAALGGLAALLVQGMVGVQSASAWLLFWLYLALLAALLRAVGSANPADGEDAAATGRPRAGSASSRREKPRRRPQSTPVPGGRSLPMVLGAGLVAAMALLMVVRLNLQPLLADVVAAEGEFLASRSRFEEAHGAFHRALELSPQAEYHLRLGQAATRAAEGAPLAAAQAWLQRGEAALREAERLDPLDLDVALAQGRLYQTRGSLLAGAAELESAQRSFERALRLSPRRAYVRNRYGALLALQGDHRGALEQYAVSLELDPGYAATHGFLADSLVALGRLEEALEAYRRASRLDPALVLVRINLGELYLRLGRLQEAAQEYRAAVELAPEDRSLRLRLSEIEARGPTGS